MEKMGSAAAHQNGSLRFDSSSACKFENVADFSDLMVGGSRCHEAFQVQALQAWSDKLGALDAPLLRLHCETVALPSSQALGAWTDLWHRVDEVSHKKLSGLSMDGFVASRK